MIQIQTIEVGLEKKVGTQILMIPKIGNTQDKTCSMDWRILSEDEKDLDSGTVHFSEEQYAEWGTDNDYAEDIVLKELGLERKL